MKYSVVVPIYYDGYLAPAFCEELASVMRTYMGTDEIERALELIFVNDGSRDESMATLLALRAEYAFVRVIDLSRNFGQHAAIACGMHEARGDVVLRMNVDMQDPPAEIPKLLRVLQDEDVDLVVGQYATRNSPFLNRITAYVYFWLFKLMTGFDTPQNSSPLRAMSRRFVRAYNALTEKSRFPQGLDQWLGFRHRYVEIEHRERADKRSSYNLWSRLKLAANGILYFSDRPLQLMASAGFLVAVVGVCLGGYVVVERMFGGAFLPGYASLVSIALLAFGIQLGCTGLVGLYIAKIFKEVQNRPLYVIRTVFEQGSVEITTRIPNEQRP